MCNDNGLPSKYQDMSCTCKIRNKHSCSLYLKMPQCLWCILHQKRDSALRQIIQSSCRPSVQAHRLFHSLPEIAIVHCREHHSIYLSSFSALKKAMLPNWWWASTSLMHYRNIWEELRQWTCNNGADTPTPAAMVLNTTDRWTHCGVSGQSHVDIFHFPSHPIMYLLWTHKFIG